MIEMHYGQLGIGVIGAGRIGTMHATNLATRVPGARLVAVADVTLEAAQGLAGRFDADAYDHHERLMERPDVDAVVICSSTGAHGVHVRDAAAAGKHIFCEKPLALTLEGCDDAIRATDEAGVTLQVGFMRRFDPPYVEARRKIAEGVIGRPVVFRGIGRDPGPPPPGFARRENSGGLIADMGVHEFDLAQWLMGARIDRVHAEGACLVYPQLGEEGDIDNVVVSLRFEDGRLGSVELSRNAVYGYDIRSEVLGSEGSLWIEDVRRTGLAVLTRSGSTHDTYSGFVERFEDAYLNEMKDFVANLLAGRPASVSGADARSASEVAVAATRSLDEGRPVQLAELLETEGRLVAP